MKNREEENDEMEASLLFGERPQASELLRRARAVGGAAREAGRRIERHPRLRRLRDAAGGRFGPRLSVEAAAGAVFLSGSAFERNFRRAVGLSFHRFLILDGLSRAIGRLEAGDDSVTSVALEAGFTLGSLEYNFRRHLGCSPSAYRDAHRSQPRRGATIGGIDFRGGAGRPDRAARTASVRSCGPPVEEEHAYARTSC